MAQRRTGGVKWRGETHTANRKPQLHSSQEAETSSMGGGMPKGAASRAPVPEFGGKLQKPDSGPPPSMIRRCERPACVGGVQTGEWGGVRWAVQAAWWAYVCPLAPAQWPIPATIRDRTAVVAKQHQERVLPHARGPQRRCEVAERLVYRDDHPGVVGAGSVGHRGEWRPDEPGGRSRARRGVRNKVLDLEVHRHPCVRRGVRVDEVIGGLAVELGRVAAVAAYRGPVLVPDVEAGAGLGGGPVPGLVPVVDVVDRAEEPNVSSKPRLDGTYDALKNPMCLPRAGGRAPRAGRVRWAGRGVG